MHIFEIHEATRICVIVITLILYLILLKNFAKEDCKDTVYTFAEKRKIYTVHILNAYMSL